MLVKVVLEIGRKNICRNKMLCPRGRAGSSPAIPTKKCDGIGRHWGEESPLRLKITKLGCVILTCGVEYFNDG